MKAKLAVRTPFGTFTRTTARAYKFLTISTGISAATFEARYQRELASDQKYLAEYQQVLAALRAAGKPFAKRLDGTSIAEANYMRAHNLPKGHIEFYDVKPDGYDGIGMWSVEEWEKFANDIRKTMATNPTRRDKAIAEEQAKGYRDIQWSSRLELARKYADQHREYGHENVRIIDVQTGEEVK